MIVTVTGGRRFDDRGFVNHVLDVMHESEPITTLRHGGAEGTDTLASEWAQRRQVPVQMFQAMWDRDGKRAGPMRNRRMLDARPVCEGLVAFPGGPGTAGCVLEARKRRIPVFEVGKLYREWLNRPKSFGDMAVEAGRALMAEMQANGAFEGLLKVDLGGKGELPPEMEPFAPKRPGIDEKGPEDVLE